MAADTSHICLKTVKWCLSFSEDAMRVPRRTALDALEMVIDRPSQHCCMVWRNSQPSASADLLDCFRWLTCVCAPTATRTRDLPLRRRSLYPLSYRGLPKPNVTWDGACSSPSAPLPMSKHPGARPIASPLRSRSSAPDACTEGPPHDCTSRPWPPVPRPRALEPPRRSRCFDCRFR